MPSTSVSPPLAATTRGETALTTREWLAGLSVVAAEKCDWCGDPEGPFVATPGSKPRCHLCAVEFRALDQGGAELAAELITAALRLAYAHCEETGVKALADGARLAADTFEQDPRTRGEDAALLRITERAS